MHNVMLGAFERTITKALHNTIPLTAHISLTEKCNLHCKHCYLSEKPSPADMDLGLLRKALGELRKAGTLLIILSGGECSCHSNFLEAVKLVKDNRFAFRIYTNGYKWTGKMIDEVVALQPLSVSISLYGSTPEIHEDVTGEIGSFELTKNTIKTFNSRGVRVQLKAPVMKSNAYDMPNIRKLADEMEVEINESAYIYPPQDDENNYNNVCCTEKELCDYLSQVENTETTPKVKSQTDYLCGAGRNYVAIGTFGDVYPCPMFNEAAGNLKNADFMDIWENASLFKKLRSYKKSDIKACSNCEYAATCMRCVAAVYNLTKKFDVPDIQACQFSKIRGRLKVDKKITGVLKL